jgi:hypothetical protein
MIASQWKRLSTNLTWQPFGGSFWKDSYSFRILLPEHIYVGLNKDNFFPLNKDNSFPQISAIRPPN